MTVEAVVAQTPGKGWRWRTEDTGTIIDQGLAYHATSAAAADDAVRAIGTNWPGSPTEVFDTISDAEEDGWHYVGATGEPAFGTDWANATSDRHLAFRIREAGVVDVQGVIENTNAPGAPSTATVFVLPEGYRPSSDTDQGIALVQTDEITDASVGLPVNVTATGDVDIQGVANDPIPGATGVADQVRIFGQYFLDPPSAP